VADDDPGQVVDETPEATETTSVVGESRRDRAARYAKVAKARADALRQQATDRFERLEADRERRPLVDVVFAMRDEDDRIAGREMAAAVAYRLFFLMLPLILVFVGGIGLTAASDEGAAEDAVRSSGTSAAVARSIANATSDLSILEHIVVLGIGVWGTYAATKGLMKTLGRVNAISWQVPLVKPPKPLRVVGIVLVIVLALILVSHEWNQIRGKLGVLEFLIALPVVGAIYGALIVELHAQLPRPDDARWTRLVPGAALVGLSIASLQAFLLGYVARKLSSSSELYGGVGTAFVVLFWLYLLGRVLVLGPVLDGVLWRRRNDRGAAEPS
jgi:membrane protein